jgi:hypothetical protein
MNVQIDAVPRPLAYWAEQWDCHPKTIERWIREGTCPHMLVGGRKMISALQLYNFEHPVGVKKEKEIVGPLPAYDPDDDRTAPLGKSTRMPKGGWAPSMRTKRKGEPA